MSDQVISEIDWSQRADILGEALSGEAGQIILDHLESLEIETLRNGIVRTELSKDTLLGYVLAIRQIRNDFASSIDKIRARAEQEQAKKREQPAAKVFRPGGSGSGLSF